VLLAVHGARRTSQIFLPTGAVLVQIVPWGKMDWMATNFYGQPARDMRLGYVERYVSEEEIRGERSGGPGHGEASVAR
jgi:hypothetical protein